MKPVLSHITLETHNPRTNNTAFIKKMEQFISEATLPNSAPVAT